MNRRNRGLEWWNWPIEFFAAVGVVLMFLPLLAGLDWRGHPLQPIAAKVWSFLTGS